MNLGSVVWIPPCSPRRPLPVEIRISDKVGGLGSQKEQSDLLSLAAPAGKIIPCIFFPFLSLSQLRKYGRVPGGEWVREKQNVMGAIEGQTVSLLEILSLLIFFLMKKWNL